MHESRFALALFCFLLIFSFVLFGQDILFRVMGSCPFVMAQQDSSSKAQDPALAPTPTYTVKIVKDFPHDPEAFTEGLIFANGFLYESTGLNGRSSLRKVELETGRIVQKYSMPNRFFGEGLTFRQGELIQLTWRSNTGFVYNPATFTLQRQFTYNSEGWGLTHDGNNLIMSSGGNKLTYLNPETFSQEKVLPVTSRGKPVQLLNELEYIKGEIFANIWLKDTVVRISPKTGEVTGWIEMSSLRKALPPGSNAEVLNGIAYDAEGDRIFVTGKFWPKIFQIEIVKSE